MGELARLQYRHLPVDSANNLGGGSDDWIGWMTKSSVE